ncbi:tyrosine-type recombinase/integrase [Dictyobacter formicarum]|uniref:Tyrosine recombinase XerD n=1 Tax=Dictyobacter formicarum TaxID=2778368 RepID=A0ABQ3VRD6_9CHLR|nr:tyrosine-type recombinase/integrase [Dictyobacter formicarum]GHO88720.1 tyrosine recombinase XerD [Dictyobacter formicarum]
MLIREAIKLFIESRELDNCTAKGIRTYDERLRYFVGWLEANHGIEDLDDLRLDHLRGWIAHLKKHPSERTKQPLSDRTIHSYGKALLVFCHWIEQEEMIDKPISTRFKLPKFEKKFIPTFNTDDVEKLLAACEEGDETKPSLRKALTARNRAIVSLFLDTGIRLKELAGLRLRDIDKNAYVLLVHRKGNKWQQVPVSRDGFKPLHVYLTKHRPFLAQSDVAHKDDSVFLNSEGGALSYGGIESLFKRLKTRTGIDGKRVSPHNCRRYMATTQLRLGRSPLDVQRQMGHTTLSMTNEYASLTVEHLKKSHEMYSPLRAKDQDEEENIDDGYWNAD